LYRYVEWKGFIIAYHAVPDRYLTQNDLKALQGGATWTGLV
jgi:hypothetical protein